MRLRTRFSPLPSLLLAGLALSACSDGPGETTAPADDSPPPVLSVSECVPPLSDGLLASRIEGLGSQVDLLEDEGLLNQGQLRALRRHLDNASRQLDRQEYCAVYDQIEAFLEQVNDLVGDGFLSDRQAFELRLQSRLAMGPGEPVQPAAEEYAPGASGEIRTAMIGDDEITYEVIDGLALLNSDMILGYADEFEAAIAGGGSGVTPTAGGPLPTTPCLNTELSCARWTDGVIGFDFFPDWDENTPAMIDIIVQAINHWREKTGMEFERRSTGQRIIFRNGSGCSSWIGRNPFAIFDPQYIFLQWPGCASMGIVAHEIGHAVGLHHEQNRARRNSFLDVNFDVIKEGKEHNFYECLALCQRVGFHDFGSIMHYGCDAFQKDGAAKLSLEPIIEGVTCDDLGQRDALSDGDVLGSYYLYRPAYEITGASDGDVSDRFVLEATFSTEPVDGRYINWTVDRNRVSTGLTLSTLDLGLAPGTYTIGADLVINQYTLAIDYLTLTIANDAPVVSLGPDRPVDMNRAFTVVAGVTDTEDGSCPLAVCSYAWDPEPANDLGGAAEYLFPTVPDGGTATIGVTVTDGFGATGGDEVTVSVVDSPPVPVIDLPTNGSTFSSGATTSFSGSATDANYGPGPGPGDLPCSQLAWSSSDATDVVSGSPGCNGTVTFGDPGVRTLTLQASDGTGNSASASVSIEVEGCTGGCAPDISIILDTPPELDGTLYSPPFTGSGYDLNTPIEMHAPVSDSDGPPTSIALEWRVREPCLGGGCPETVIGTASVYAPTTSYLTWTPSSDIEPWTACTSTALPYVLILEATDGGGASRTFERTVYLACQII